MPVTAEDMERFRGQVDDLARYVLRGNSKFVIATRAREKESYHMVGNLVVIGDRLITREEACHMAPCSAKSARSVQ